MGYSTPLLNAKPLFMAFEFFQPFDVKSSQRAGMFNICRLPVEQASAERQKSKRKARPPVYGETHDS